MTTQENAPKKSGAPKDDARKLYASDAQELFECQDTDEPVGGWEFVEIVEGDDRRWSRTNQIILRWKGDYYALEFEQGLTEMCDNEYPWKPDYRDPPEFVEVYRVYPTTKIVTEYWRTVQGGAN